MAKLKPIPEIINGFKIVKDLGSILYNGKKRRVVIANCKACQNPFTECVDVLSRKLRLACSRECAVNFKLANIKYVDGFKNKFKVLSVGNILKGKRQITVECPFCLNPFKSSLQGIKRTTQCGCQNYCKNVNPRLVRIRGNMIQRCTNPKNTNYSRYGARGISVCSEWMSPNTSFFEWALSNGYSDELSLDRINNDGNYEPSNCRWATRKEQMANTRKSKGKN